MNSRNRKFNRRNTSQIHRINNLIRRNCCWNCLQVGHLRFQCPYPKSTRCSFCRKPFVRSINCNCPGSARIRGVPEHHNVQEDAIQPEDPQPIHIERVLICANDPQPDRQNDIVICVENDAYSPSDEEHEDKDILEINTENDFLDEI